MPEIAHDTDEGFHEIQLSGKQLVFLFMATTVVSVVIFLCGVLVGRGVRAEALGADEAIGAAAANVPASAPLDAVPAEPVAQDPPLPSPEPDLSYHQRLQNERPPAEDFRTRAEAPAKPEPAKSEPATPEPAKPAAAPAARTGTAGAGARPGTWAVQVVSLSDRAAAAQIVQRLSTRGYPAFLVAPVPGAPSQLYKVQVGRYDDRREAQKISTRLRQEERFEPWIVR